MNNWNSRGIRPGKINVFGFIYYFYYNILQSHITIHTCHVNEYHIDSHVMIHALVVNVISVTKLSCQFINITSVM
jgi:hypothetical protein